MTCVIKKEYNMSFQRKISLVYIFTLILLAACAKKPANSTLTIGALNGPSGLSLVGVLVAGALWLAAGWIGQSGGSGGPSYPLGGLAVGLLAISSLLALIGASDPRPRRGKLLALLTLAVVGIAVMVFLWRLSQ